VRALTTAESALLRLLLEGDAQEVSELRAQVPATAVVEPWLPGSASLHLAVGSGAAKSHHQDGPVAVDAWVYDTSGNVVGTLVVWVTDGYLSGLEYGWVTDDRPTALPDPSLVRVTF
jgi:hypothetical protein